MWFATNCHLAVAHLPSYAERLVLEFCSSNPKDSIFFPFSKFLSLVSFRVRVSVRLRFRVSVRVRIRVKVRF